MSSTTSRCRCASAPLRLRVETQLGYKMVKYLQSIELIEDYRTQGDGQGGSREDAQFFGRGAESRVPPRPAKRWTRS